MVVRTRFAPSPTGYMHLGNARTALFSYLFARHHGGEFFLRIEDTDRTRSSESAIEVIFEALDWLGLEYDNEPMYQTKRFEHYQSKIQQLLEKDQAYLCDCSKERLTALRDEQERLKRKPQYDGHCRERQDIDPNQPHVVRFKTPKTGTVSFVDHVRGDITIDNAELDDLIIQRSDGAPTYNFCVVIDDTDMEITHVIRGVDHLNNTARQVHLFDALEYAIPEFAHLPLILGSDGQLLSKRHGAVNVLAYRDAGFLPEALCNYLVRLGWSHGDTELFSREDMCQLFELTGVRKAPSAFDLDKLNWFNQQYLKTIDNTRLVDLTTQALQQLGISKVDARISEIVELQRERAKTIVELAEKSRFFFEPVETWPPELLTKHFKVAVMPTFKLILEQFKTLEAWQPEGIHQIMSDTIEAQAQKFGKVAQPIRIAVTGGVVSPPLDATLSFIGKSETLKRMQGALSALDALEQAS